MNRRQEFLARAIETHRAYDDATDVLRQLLRSNKANSSEWFEAFARQQQALEEWSSLPRIYGSFDVEE
jgi:hypothetical protein